MAGFSRSFMMGRRPKPSDYEIITSHNQITEGQQLTVTLNTVDVPSGTNIPFTITGVTSDDIDGFGLTGNFFILSNTASFVVTITADYASESEVFTIALDDHPVSRSVVINDLWIPSELGTLLEWYDISDAAGFSGSNSSVTTLIDKAGSNDLTRGQPTNTPITRTTNLSPNGERVAYFAGDQFLVASSSQSTVDNGNHFAIMVVRPTTVDNDKDSVWCYDGDNINDRDYAVSANHSSKFLGEVDLGNNAAPVGILGPWGSVNYETKWNVFVVVFDSSQGSIYVRVDGTQVDSTTYSNDLAENQLLRLMANRNGNKKQQGYFGEFCSVKGLPGTGGADQSFIEKLEGYLAHKWDLAGNLPVSHPYKSSPPTKT